MARIFAALAFLAALPLAAQQWNPTLNFGGGWNNHDMVFDGARNAYLVWPIMFSRSMDNGRSWSHPQPYGDPRLGRYGNPDLAIDSAGVLYLVYEFMPNGATLYQLWFMRSLDRGQTWSAPRQISNTARFTGWPKVEVDSNGRLHVVWHDICNLHNWSDPPLPGCSGADLYHLTSTDRGDTWTQQWIVSGRSPWTIHTAVDRAGGFYAFWSFSPGPGNPGGVYMYKTADGGATWTATFLGPGNESAAAIDSDGTVHVLFVSGPPDNLVVNYRRGAHGGTVWSDSVVLTGIVGQSGYNPNWVTIGADPKNNVLMAYQSGVSGNFEIYFSRSPNGGKTWLKSENISNTLDYSLEPDLFVDSGSVVHLVWNEVVPGAFQVHYRRGPMRGN